MSGFCFVTFSEHTCSVTGVVFTPNSQVVLSCSLDGTVRAFDLKRYKNSITFSYKLGWRATPSVTQLRRLTLFKFN